jgi:hypothetical protein
MTPLRSVLYTILAILFVAGVIVGGYLGGWWLQKDTTDRRVSIENRNLGVQTAWHDRATDLINQAALLPEDAPQRAALERQACELIGRLVDAYRSDDLVAFETTECN